MADFSLYYSPSPSRRSRSNSTPGGSGGSNGSQASGLKSKSCPQLGSPDRFIPLRSHLDLPAAGYMFSKENKKNSNNLDCEANALLSSSKEDYKATLEENLNVKNRHSLLSFSPAKNKGARQSGILQHDMVYGSLTESQAVNSPSRPPRLIPQTPERILDAPDLLDDYYLNLLDWSSQGQLAVALGQSVYLWTPAETVELCRVKGHEDYISSLSWMEDGTHLAVGTNDAVVQIWDPERQVQIRSMKGHVGRVSSLAWNNHLLSSGSRDSMIHHHDVRVARHHVATLQTHSHEVCGLKWSPDGSQLASGGNDNMLCIWDAANAESPTHKLEDHTAAVKAIAWCPWQRNLLVSGGGTADRSIRFWNTSSGAALGAVDTKSQVCSLVWSKDRKELVSSHGFSQNQLIVWKYPTMSKIAELTGHTARVLHMTASPDGSTIVSAAGDETLRFWNIFGDNAKGGINNSSPAKKKRRSSSSPNTLSVAESPASMSRYVHIR